MPKHQNQQRGVVLLISLLIAVALMLLIGSAMYFRKSKGSNATNIERGKQGIEQTKQNNEVLRQQQEQIQKQLQEQNQ